MNTLLVCTATDLERRLLVAAGIPTLLTGIGPVASAIALTRRLAREPVERILICGVGGAYPGSGLDLLDVAVAASETFGDLGVETGEGFVSVEALGFDTPSRFDLDLLPAAPEVPRVPFVTCSTCTGTDRRAASLVERTGGSVESMEGAALVQAARSFGLPVGEIRGISNSVGDRDRSAWRIEEAAVAAQEALLAWLRD